MQNANKTYTNLLKKRSFPTIKVETSNNLNIIANNYKEIQYKQIKIFHYFSRLRLPLRILVVVVMMMMMMMSKKVSSILLKIGYVVA